MVGGGARRRRSRAWFERARQFTDSRSLKELLDRKLRSTFS